jgi:hypothetical protein
MMPARRTVVACLPFNQTSAVTAMRRENCTTKAAQKLPSHYDAACIPFRRVFCWEGRNESVVAIGSGLTEDALGRCFGTPAAMLGFSLPASPLRPLPV